jgi:hypothetical protein
MASCTPELLKGFLQKVSAYGLEVVSEQIAYSETVFRFQVLFAFEQQPARLLHHWHTTLACYAARFSGTDFVQCFVHFRHDVKTVESVGPNSGRSPRVSRQVSWRKSIDHAGSRGIGIRRSTSEDPADRPAPAQIMDHCRFTLLIIVSA